MKISLLISLIFLSASALANNFRSDHERNRKLLDSLQESGVSEWLSKGSNSRLKVPEKIPKSWDHKEFSNPRKHSNDNFVYIVTALRNFDPSKISLKKFGQKGRPIYASMISSTDLDLFGEFGLILKIEPEHVIGTSLVDTHFNFKDYLNYEAAVETYTRNFGIFSPQEMYLGSHWEKYFTRYGLLKMFEIDTVVNNNEILLHGVDRFDRSVEIEGVYIASPRTFGYEDQVLALQEFAKKNDLPVISINLQSIRLKFEENEFE